jgi:hypothetical protein
MRGEGTVMKFISLTVGAYYLSLKPKRFVNETTVAFCHTTLA